MQEPTQPIQVRLPKSLVRQLKAYVLENETTLTSMVETALRRTLKDAKS